MNEKLEPLDFVIEVLRQHEKVLDEAVFKLEKITGKMEEIAPAVERLEERIRETEKLFQKLKTTIQGGEKKNLYREPMMAMSADRRFNRLLLEAIDEALSSLGESVKKAIYYRLEEDFHISKPEIPQKIQAFNRAMEEMFKEGASHLQISMMKQIHQKTGEKLTWTEDKKLTFPKYVTAVKQNFLKGEKV